MLSAVLRRTVPAHLDAGPSLHSISIRPASAANAGGFLQVVESKAREYATLRAHLASSRFRFNTKTSQELSTSNTIRTKFPRLKNTAAIGPIVARPRFSR